MRLIDADALMDAFRSYMAERYDREKCVSEENCKTCDRPCLWRRVVSEAPTVDAVEVVHGRWLPTNDDNKKKCSQCDVIHLIAQYPHGQANYCPNCGAKMDGGNEDGKAD